MEMIINEELQWEVSFPLIYCDDVTESYAKLEEYDD
jgi:hypothetical protein